MKLKTLLPAAFSLVLFNGFSQDEPGQSYEYLNHPVDIDHYEIALTIRENSNEIRAQELIRFVIKEPCDSFFLDLQSLNNGKGMKIESLTVDYEYGVYSHRDNRIWIKTKPGWIGEQKSVSINYSGVPETGLIIGENKFGEQTYFGDNWPNRAHHWFACVDHPNDKATVYFTTLIPKKYECIATGNLISHTELGLGLNKYVYQSDIELPTKVMVVGIADFSTKEYESDLSFPVSAWVYSKDAENGFRDMAVSVEVLNYFIETVGEYPYEKLANVQSTTQFGGMENAGNIFYDENAVTGNETMEALIAHEIAHQWFGNSASELDWPHIWLSEGFATYFTDLYWEKKYGTDAMNKRLKSERTRVIGFSKNYDHPVVDKDYATLMDLLNPNSYQKGAWVLHMLRNEVGDTAFFEGVRQYYEKFKFSNAATSDFITVMQEVSGKDLEPFFNQWLHTAGHPVLHFRNGVKTGGFEYIEIEQQQNDIFEFDLDVQILYQDGTNETVTYHVSEKEQKFDIPRKKEVEGFVYDPNVKLLFEEIEY